MRKTDTAFLVTVPPIIKWLPALAQQLMEGIFTIPDVVSLYIVATEQSVRWLMGTANEQLLKNIVFAVYPQAQISQVRVEFLDYDSWDAEFAMAGVLPFVASLPVAEDYAIDPLASIIQTMGALEPGEQITYQLVFIDPRQSYEELEDLAEEFLSRPLTEQEEYLGNCYPDQRAKRLKEGRLVRFRGGFRKEKSKPDRAKRAKLYLPLKEVIFFINIKANSRYRVKELKDLLYPAIRWWYQGSVPTNELMTLPIKGTHKLFLSPAEMAVLWHLPTEGCYHKKIVWTSKTPPTLFELPAKKGEYVVLGTSEHFGQQLPVRLSYPDRVTHVNLIGKNGVGKSTLLHAMIHQDIANGHGVGVIDPHGDLIEAVLQSSIPNHREKDVVLFDLKDTEYPIGLNLLSGPAGVSTDVIASQALAVIRKMFAENWSSTRMESVLDAALRSLVSYKGATIQDVPKILLNADFRRQVLKGITDYSVLEYWHEEYDPMKESRQREFASPITNRLRKFYRDPSIRRIVCQSGSLNLRPLMDSKKIFLASLSGPAAIEAETLGSLMVSKFQMAAMSRTNIPVDQRIPFYLYIDEVQNFVTTSLAVIFSEARKYGLSLVVANQFLKQLEGDTLEAVLGNVGSSIIFRTGPQDARVLGPLVKPEFSPEDLLNLDRFHTVVKMQVSGQTLPAFSMITEPPISIPEDYADRVARIKDQSRAQYGRPASEVDEELAAQFGQEQTGGADQAAKPDIPADQADTPPDSEDGDDWRDDLAE